MATCKISEFLPASQGTPEARIHALETALAYLTRELSYVLSHLDDANFTPEERDRFVSEVTARVKEDVGYGETS